jgi:O-methyltransferase involved in polyketide biosynthesis
MKPAEGNQRIGIPAYFTSHAWVEAGFSHAHLFSTRRGRLMFRALEPLFHLFGFLGPAVRRHNDYLFVRHYALEARMRQIRPTCIVEVGAGLSPRGIAFASSDPDLRYIEVDLPNMVAAKKRALGSFPTPSNYFLGCADLLAAGFSDSLRATPRPEDRLVVVTEGVTDYFNMAEKRTAFGNICALLRAQGGGHYLLDVYAREHFPHLPFLTHAFVKTLGHMVGRSFEDQLFERVEDACRFLTGCGFDRARQLDLAELNTSPYQPPMEHCTFRILEAVVTGRSPSQRESRLAGSP